MLNEVLKLKSKGISVIPTWGKLAPNKDQAKRPMVSWQEYQKRHATQDELIKWFDRRGQLPNVAVITGSISQLIVLDIDGTQGEKSIKKFNLPFTWTVKTRRGRHFYFRWSPVLASLITTKVGVLPGVDVRGEGGYVVAPPSLGYDGTPYHWERAPHSVPLAVPPKWLVDLLPAKGQTLANVKHTVKSKHKKDAIMQTLDEIKEGNRNESFTRIAGSLRARGYGSDTIFNLLRGTATEVLFPLDELRTVCNSVSRYKSTRFNHTDASDIENFLEDVEIVDWICEPIVAKKTLGFIAGLPETMKTWMMIDLAVECARGGGLWLGRFPTKGAKILFIDQERFKGETQRRFKAIIQEKDIDPKQLKDNLFVRCGTSTRLDLNHSFDAFRKEVADIRPDIIIVDSFATFHTKEENNRRDIQEVLERVKQIRNEFKCTFLFIDHENKGVFHAKTNEEQPSAMRMVGSIAKPAAAELVLTVRRHDIESSFVYHTKSTLASTIAPFLVKVQDLNLSRSKIKVEAF